jgi:amidophosphoribosyltransferase
MLRSAGAAEVHLRITSPPIANPCYYGIDMASRAELIGADLSLDEIRDFIGCDSLHYISLDRLIDSTPNRTRWSVHRMLHRAVSHPGTG